MAGQTESIGSNVEKVKVLVAQSCLTLCDPMDCSPPGSSVHGILQARMLEWVAMPSPGDLPDPGIEPRPLMSPALAGGFFTTSAANVRASHKLKKVFQIILGGYLSQPR